jgi:hypothetical protein
MIGLMSECMEFFTGEEISSLRLMIKVDDYVHTWILRVIGIVVEEVKGSLIWSRNKASEVAIPIHIIHIHITITS